MSKIHTSIRSSRIIDSISLHAGTYESLRLSVNTYMNLCLPDDRLTRVTNPLTTVSFYIDYPLRARNSMEYSRFRKCYELKPLRKSLYCPFRWTKFMHDTRLAFTRDISGVFARETRLPYDHVMQITAQIMCVLCSFLLSCRRTEILHNSAIYSCPLDAQSVVLYFFRILMCLISCDVVLCRTMMQHYLHIKNNPLGNFAKLYFLIGSATCDDVHVIWFGRLIRSKYYQQNVNIALVIPNTDSYTWKQKRWWFWFYSKGFCQLILQFGDCWTLIVCFYIMHELKQILCRKTQQTIKFDTKQMAETDF